MSVTVKVEATVQVPMDVVASIKSMSATFGSDLPSVLDSGMVPKITAPIDNKDLIAAIQALPDDIAATTPLSEAATEFQIEIKSLFGKVTPLMVKSSTTGRELLYMIEAKEAIPPFMMRLWFGGRWVFTGSPEDEDPESLQRTLEDVSPCESKITRNLLTIATGGRG